jgi:hypothetical protein
MRFRRGLFRFESAVVIGSPLLIDVELRLKGNMRLTLQVGQSHIHSVFCYN